MKAKNPNGEGFINVRFATEAEGHYHSLICNHSNYVVGGHLHSEGKPLGKPDKYSICPSCGDNDLRYSECPT